MNVKVTKQLKSCKFEFRV